MTFSGSAFIYVTELIIGNCINTLMWSEFTAGYFWLHDFARDCKSDSDSWTQAHQYCLCTQIHVEYCQSRLVFGNLYLGKIQPGQKLAGTCIIVSPVDNWDYRSFWLTGTEFYVTDVRVVLQYSVCENHGENRTNHTIDLLCYHRLFSLFLLQLYFNWSMFSQQMRSCKKWKTKKNFVSNIDYSIFANFSLVPSDIVWHAKYRKRFCRYD